MQSGRKVLNPLTGRYVKADGVIGRVLVATTAIAAAAAPSHTHQARSLHATTAPKIGKNKRKSQSRSARAGLQFSVDRVAGALKDSAKHAHQQFDDSAAVYLTATMEYLMAELLELSGNAARDSRRVRIAPDHVFTAMEDDPALLALVENMQKPYSVTQLLEVERRPLPGFGLFSE